MVFGLFARKPTTDAEASPDSNTGHQLQDTRLPTPTPSIASVARHSPLRFSTVFRNAQGDGTSDSVPKDSDLPTDDVAEGESNVHPHVPPRPVTPSPPPVGPRETKALHDLMLAIPPKTLHAYTLARLCPQPPQPLTSMPSPAFGSHLDNAPRPPSPHTASKLTAFFSNLAPPPSLHCVRCHKDFYEVENEEKDRACRIPHDDESALVSRVSGGTYETLWGCCGQTASGDGSEGPPDGWCYEGRHTTDIKRARFRADSTVHDDKLTSCLRLNCHGIRDQLPCGSLHASPSRSVRTPSVRKYNPSPVRSQASVLILRSSRKRPRKSLREASGSESEADAESSVGRVLKTKDKEKADRGAGEGDGDGDASIAVDELNLPSRPRVKAKSRPVSRAHSPPSTPTTTSLPTSGSNLAPVASRKSRTTTAKPKSTSRTLISQGHTQPASDSEASTHSRPRTRSRVREESHARDASRTRTPSKVTKTVVSVLSRRASKALKPLSQSPTSQEGLEVGTEEYQESEQEGRGRDRKKRRVGRS